MICKYNLALVAHYKHLQNSIELKSTVIDGRKVPWIQWDLFRKDKFGRLVRDTNGNLCPNDDFIPLLAKAKKGDGENQGLQERVLSNDPAYDMTTAIHSGYERIRKSPPNGEENTLRCYYGLPGSGKSLGALTDQSILDPFQVENFTMRKIAWPIEELLDRIKEFPAGNVALMKDEQRNESGVGIRLRLARLANAAENLRKDKFSFLICSPDIKEQIPPGTVHSFYQFICKDIYRRWSKCIWRDTQYLILGYKITAHPNFILGEKSVETYYREKNRRNKQVIDQADITEYRSEEEKVQEYRKILTFVSADGGGFWQVFGVRGGIHREKLETHLDKVFPFFNRSIGLKVVRDEFLQWFEAENNMSKNGSGERKKIASKNIEFPCKEECARIISKKSRIVEELTPREYETQIRKTIENPEEAIRRSEELNE